MEKEVSHDKRVHLGDPVRIEGVGGRVDDGLAAKVERSIENHRRSRRFPEGIDKPVIEGAFLLNDGLKPSRSIDMRDGRERGLFFLTNGNDKQHKARGIVALRLIDIEIFPGAIRQDGRRERPEGFPEFNFGVNDLFHLFAGRVGQD